MPPKTRKASEASTRVVNETARARKHSHLDQLLDEALRETFPASDPIAISVEVNADNERPSTVKHRRT